MDPVKPRMAARGLWLSSNHPRRHRKAHARRHREIVAAREWAHKQLANGAISAAWTMAKIIAKRPAEHLDRVSFVIMRKPIPASGAGYNPGARAPDRVLSVRRLSCSGRAATSEAGTNIPRTF